jgi:hypothetical protein
VQRQLAQIVAVERKDFEGVEHHLVIVLPVSMPEGVPRRSARKA